MARVDYAQVALAAQASAVRRAAARAGDGETRALAEAAADTVEAVARRQQHRKAAAAVAPVLELAANASANEVRVARQRRAVRRGKDVFLPSWKDATVALPNALLRSALFSASSSNREALFEAPIAAQGDVVLTLTGHQLCDYDRRVFAACLNHYRDDRPLSPDDASPAWVTLSFYQFAQDLGTAYGAKVHKAIRDSLIRLSAAHLRVRINRRDIPLPRLIDVAFDDGYAGVEPADCQLRGSDRVAFRIFESMANLFGPADWSAVPQPALTEYAGLAAWLASFYSTHSKPYPLKVSDLYSYAGVTCELREFRRMLKTALDKLKRDDASADLRVESYVLTKDELTVHLARWTQLALPFA
ncbi:plasmid replication initiator TrfA [Burkholderia ubonensis]|uniref:plasmid replication initiator TrfA n=1 Tax=Burkholderia ubonensis TaxID=101571 RepID=UPI000AF8916F|nr:plasmid replication initiator TrfA [Burkholderia ubonensis]